MAVDLIELEQIAAKGSDKDPVGVRRAWLRALAPELRELRRFKAMHPANVVLDYAQETLRG